MTAFFRKPVAGIYCLLALLSALLFNSCGKQENPQAVEIHGKTMGTTFQVKYLPLPSDDDQRPEAIGGEINAALIAFNQLVSTYIKDSRI
nr:FAD:protein FMN transferase [Calditrichia bacterium]